MKLFLKMLICLPLLPIVLVVLVGLFFRAVIDYAFNKKTFGETLIETYKVDE